MYPTTQKLLNNSVISLKSIHEDTISMLIKRDFNGKYSYIRELALKYGDSVDMLGLYINEILVGYSVAGLFREKEEIHGEVGMVHISPPLRDIKLGSFLYLLQLSRIFKKNPNILYCEVADQTGKIQHLIEKSGFMYSSEDSKDGGHPIWLKKFLSNKDQAIFGQQLQETIEMRLSELNKNHKKLIAQTEKVLK
ncbi:MAG TPA: hypothetical protein VLF93_07860 [Candidatus Saccharimonadales bacterium]|nr:hypothetical protein [Candidatus Saccharimonadales bacterium]